MDEKKVTIKKTVDANQAATFLRLLADELEGINSPVADAAGIQLHDFNKLKIALIKEEGGQLALTFKVKEHNRQRPVAATEFTDISEREYGPFKQQLKATYSQLLSLASQATLPAPELLAQFMAQSKRLITFAGFGDPYYHDYWQACLAMEQAVSAGQIAAFQERLAAIQALKKACHQRFK